MNSARNYAWADRCADEDTLAAGAHSAELVSHVTIKAPECAAEELREKGPGEFNALIFEVILYRPPFSGRV